MIIVVDKIRTMKKIELHLHLDGSVRLETAVSLTGKDRSDLVKEMVASSKCENLSEYLTKFDLPISIMQTKDSLKKVASDLVDYLEKENVIYAEVRFAPMFHVRDGLSYEEVVDAVLDGLNNNSNVKTNLILCMMRGMNRTDNIKTIEVTDKYLGKGVCAVDLAGAEDKYPLEDYLELFDIVKEKGIPFTIHAGENGSYEEVKKAISIGAKRIGHGIHAIDNDNTLNMVKDNGVLLEICPTSNVQTNAVDIYDNHPIKRLFDMGISISVNTDNVTVSNVSISDEYIKLYNSFGFNIDEFNRINIMAIENSFLSDIDKEKIKILFM